MGAKAGIVNAERNEAKTKLKKTADLKEAAEASTERAKELATKLVEDRKMKQEDESVLEQTIKAAATASTPELKASTKAALQNAKAQLLKSKRTVTELETQDGLVKEKMTKQDRKASKDQEQVDERAAKVAQIERTKKQNADFKEQMFKDGQSSVLKQAQENGTSEALQRNANLRR